LPREQSLADIRAKDEHAALRNDGSGRCATAQFA